jgi:hypothetical protein
MSIKLDKIQMIEASCLSFNVKSEGIEEVRGFVFDYNAQTKLEMESKLVFIQLKIAISIDADNKPEVGSFNFGFTYRVENLDELVQSDNGSQVLDKTLHMSLLGIAFSTARGIILTKSANTIIYNAYLPIVNPAKLLAPAS